MLPGVSAYLVRNPHLAAGQDIETWLTQVRDLETPELAADDEAAIRATGEVWELSWCTGFEVDPPSPVGERAVAAATLERVLELARGAEAAAAAPAARPPTIDEQRGVIEAQYHEQLRLETEDMRVRAERAEFLRDQANATLDALGLLGVHASNMTTIDHVIAEFMRRNAALRAALAEAIGLARQSSPRLRPDDMRERNAKLDELEEKSK